jgi:hypothetical protein
LLIPLRTAVARPVVDVELLRLEERQAVCLESLPAERERALFGGPGQAVSEDGVGTRIPLVESV